MLELALQYIALDSKRSHGNKLHKFVNLYWWYYETHVRIMGHLLDTKKSREQFIFEQNKMV